MFPAINKGLLACGLVLAGLGFLANDSVWATTSARKLQKKINKAAHKAARGAKKVGGKVAEGLARVAGCIAIEWSDEDDAEENEITVDLAVGSAKGCSKHKVSRPAACPAPPVPSRPVTPAPAQVLPRSAPTKP